jgi:hypothetical protein
MTSYCKILFGYLTRLLYLLFRYDLLDIVEEPLYTNITVDVFPLEFTLAAEEPIQVELK